MKTYQAVYDRLDFFNNIFKRLKSKELDDDGELYMYRSIDPNIPLIEIDIFRKRFPDTYNLYLDFFYDTYLDLENQINEEIELIENSTKDKNKKYSIGNSIGIYDLSSITGGIVYHLETILGIEYKSEDQDKPEIKAVKNINQRSFIFTEPKHFELFEHWRSEIKKNVLAEYSFIYWQMVKDGYIYENVRPTEFINWLNKNYEIALNELKQYDNCKGGGKISRYRTAKLLFQC